MKSVFSLGILRHSLPSVTLQRLIFLFCLFHVCIRVDAARLAKEQAAKEKRAREEAERRRRREAEARAEQDRREVEAKEQEAAAYADLQRGRAVVGKPVRVQWGGGTSYVGRVTEFNEDDGKHMVIYTDGDVKWHDLDKMEWSEVSEAELKPRRVQRREY